MDLEPLHCARLLALAILVFAAPVTAPAEPFFLAQRPVEIAERGVFTETVLVMTNHEFSFLPPAGWRMTASTNDIAVTWLWQDLSSTLTLKIVPGPRGQTPPTQPAEQRQDILNRFPGAKINHEFVCYSSGQQGRAFDLENSVNTNFIRTARLACFPFPGGTVEFDLNCPPDLFTRHQRDFSELLNSFRISERKAK